MCTQRKFLIFSISKYGKITEKTKFNSLKMELKPPSNYNVLKFNIIYLWIYYIHQIFIWISKSFRREYSFYIFFNLIKGLNDNFQLISQIHFTVNGLQMNLHLNYVGIKKNLCQTGSSINYAVLRNKSHLNLIDYNKTFNDLIIFSNARTNQVMNKYLYKINSHLDTAIFNKIS